MRPLIIALSIGSILTAAACARDETVAAAAEVNPEAAHLPAPYNTADLKNGKRKFLLCSSCHTIKPGAVNLTGPNLHGVFGRHVGAVPDYKYSEAAQNADFVWDAEKLDEWLTKPTDFLPGTKMSFQGIKEERDRIDLIGYLLIETAKPE